ncbi:hypothetical protein IQ06DRAFT_329943 [Phaeosphaeriaceae sp. SRC1lsM3a]|nr:hypothetical protein IQ06DRAFT_329943 [Stagonospora sp. SRC1lsM3a]
MLSFSKISFWLLGALVWLLITGSSTNAAPAGLVIRDETDLHPYADDSPAINSAPKPDIPKSKEDLKTTYLKSAPKVDKSCFFTRMDVDISHPPRQKQSDSYTSFLNWVSEIFAEETSGNAFLLIPDRYNPRAESIFYSKEYKAMKDGNKVNKIMRVNFAYGTQTPTLPDPSKDDNVCKYINRDGIIKVIDTFCDEAAKQGTLDKDSGSIALDIALDYRPGLNWRPMKDKCVEQMMIATDSCDTNSNHWKGGGARKDTDVTYRWAPSSPRSVPVEQAKVWGGCEGTTGGYYTVWGANWEGDNYGSELLANLKGKGISPTQWKFNYGGGDDHREWTAWFQTIIHAWPQVESSMESVAGWGMDVRCNIG